jgi:hypothetical protein
MNSIIIQKDANFEEKEERWQDFKNNFLAWEKYLDWQNILIIKFEDFILQPKVIMEEVYNHIGLEYDESFLDDFSRKYPQRFLWETVINWNTGMSEQFNPLKAKRTNWEENLKQEELNNIYSTPEIIRFMNKFGYEY